MCVESHNDLASEKATLILQDHVFPLAENQILSSISSNLLSTFDNKLLLQNIPPQ
eukprot:TRINITY_DN9024_c0_g1_i1.p2 TRINITY_DN9024_c0_g1~~TRINITY_DN9024_c0_g1_i1.p2  ORF type:complete len:55 (-),score=0.81 TRINITY_DN9024_c0_g1_i1:279-443(-)